MKNKNVAAVLAIVLGCLGIHKFYLGKKGLGFLYLILSFTGISFLLGIIDGIRLLLQKQDDFDFEYNRSNTTQHADALFSLKGQGGQLYVFENRIIIEHKGAVGTIMHAASGSKTVPMKAIQSVQFKEGGDLTNGYIQFGILGATGSNNFVDTANNENAIFFGKSSNRNAYQIKEFIEQKIYS